MMKVFPFKKIDISKYTETILVDRVSPENILFEIDWSLFKM